MAKAKSQWDFGGELFSPQEMRRVLSVSEMTATVRTLLEERIGSVWVTGEVTNLRAQSSGHIYFSLKDANAQLSCVCFRDEARSTRHLLADGRKVVLKGDVTVYEARGQYQLLVTSIELEGVGALQVAFEKLKQKLAAEGLFAPERKRSLPALIQRIGLVTSPTGAAIADVLHVVERRHRGLQIVLSACRVQGQGAAEEVACGIAQLNEWASRGNALDAILVTRGGGSLEDLWAFNEEVVARAIFHSRVPVVSAVGHEIDFTISDFVADVRAATPSAAAELLTEGMMRRCEWAREVHAHLLDLTSDRLRTEREHVDWIRERVARIHPRRVLNERAQRLDDLRSSLLFHAKNLLRHERAELFGVAQRLVRAKPTRIISVRRQSLAEIMRRMREDARHGLTTQRRRLQVAATRLRLLSPQHVLDRGFSITQDGRTGEIIRDARRTRKGQKLRTIFAHGETVSVVEPQQPEQS